MTSKHMVAKNYPYRKLNLSKQSKIFHSRSTQVVQYSSFQNYTLSHCLFFHATVGQNDQMGFSVTLLINSSTEKLSSLLSENLLFAILKKREDRLSRQTTSHAVSNQSLWFTTENRTDEESQLRIV